MKKRQFSKEFKLEVLGQLEVGKPVAEISRQYEVKANTIYTWRQEHEKNPSLAFSGNGNSSRLESKVVQLEQTIGQLYVENGFLKRVVTRLEGKFLESKKKRGDDHVV